MKRVYEYFSRIPYPGYEVIGARVFSDKEDETTGEIEPMLSLCGGHSVFRRYEDRGVVALNNYPSLFMQFSQMDKTPGAVESFANAFGTLNVHDFWDAIRLDHDTSNVCFVALPSVQEQYVRQHIGLGKNQNSEGQHLCFVEPLRHWYAEIDRLRSAVEKWQSLKMSDEKARVEFQKLISDNSKHVIPKLLFDSSKLSLELFMYPDNLIAALWLQFALAVDGRKAYKQCENEACRSWFEIGKWGSRIDKKYCRNSCKQAVYDAKKLKTSSLTR